MKYTIILIAVLPFAFTSCMHTMMMGGHGDHEGHAATKVAKEVTSNGITLSVTIDPMTVGIASTISLSLTSAAKLPDRMNVHYMISKNSGATESSAHDHGNSPESIAEFATIHENIVLKDGKATIEYLPTVTGKFVLSVQTKVVSTDVPFTVAGKKSSGMDGMMGISSEYWYLGAIAMAGMMVVMLTVKGGIF